MFRTPFMTHVKIGRHDILGSLASMVVDEDLPPMGKALVQLGSPGAQPFTPTDGASFLIKSTVGDIFIVSISTASVPTGNFLWVNQADPIDIP